MRHWSTISQQLRQLRLLQIGTLLVVGLLCGGCSKKKTPPEEAHHNAPSIPVLPRKNYDVARLFNGIALKSSVECLPGGATALATISDTNSYKLDINLHVLWPKAATTSSDLTAATPEIGQLLPNLETLLQGITPSPDFTALQNHKEKSLKSNLASLQRLPYRDSLFDCQTILDLVNKATARRALFVQAIMNVNTDGSDGDRNLTIDKLSGTYQPQTNYRWAKTGSHPNSCLRDFESRLALIGAELSSGNLTAEDRIRLTKEQGYTKATIEELKRWDFLVGSADPFIVLPSFMVGKTVGQPSIGDYAVVIAHGVIYPAILGDLGPNSKIGEASLRICREIDGKSGAERRPSSRPEVVYIIFPGSADKPMTSPNYQHWSDRCHALWKEFGGSESAKWHEWTSLEKPWPTPTPAPTPTSSPTNSPAASQSYTSSPTPTPSEQPPGTNPVTTLPSSGSTNIPQTKTTPASSLPSPAENH